MSHWYPPRHININITPVEHPTHHARYLLMMTPRSRLTSRPRLLNTLLWESKTRGDIEVMTVNKICFGPSQETLTQLMKPKFRQHVIHNTALINNTTKAQHVPVEECAQIEDVEFFGSVLQLANEHLRIRLCVAQELCGGERGVFCTMENESVVKLANQSGSNNTRSVLGFKVRQKQNSQKHTPPPLTLLNCSLSTMRPCSLCMSSESLASP